MNPVPPVRKTRIRRSLSVIVPGRVQVGRSVNAQKRPPNQAVAVPGHPGDGEACTVALGGGVRASMVAASRRRWAARSSTAHRRDAGAGQRASRRAEVAKPARRSSPARRPRLKTRGKAGDAKAEAAAGRGGAVSRSRCGPAKENAAKMRREGRPDAPRPPDNSNAARSNERALNRGRRPAPTTAAHEKARWPYVSSSIPNAYYGIAHYRGPNSATS